MIELTIIGYSCALVKKYIMDNWGGMNLSTRGGSLASQYGLRGGGKKILVEGKKKKKEEYKGYVIPKPGKVNGIGWGP